MATELPSMDSWVVCEGVLRQVVNGVTACPRGAVPYRSCLGCHLLETTSRERARAEWCEIGFEPEALADRPPRPASAGDVENRGDDLGIRRAKELAGFVGR